MEMRSWERKAHELEKFRVGIRSEEPRVLNLVASMCFSVLIGTPDSHLFFWT